MILPRSANLLTTIFSIVSYLYALLSLTSYWAFLIPSASLPSFLQGVVLYSMDTAETVSATSAILIDIGLLALFTIPHSTLARETTKRIMKLPQCIERPLFVFQSAALLQTQMHFWKNFDAPVVWNLTGAMQAPIWTLFVAGYLFLVTASFALDHFHLFGLSQGTGININKKVGLAPAQSHKLVARWHYAFVAHPIMTGILSFLWSTPYMTLPHLLLSTANTIYILSAVILLEEPSLKREFGKEYSDYLESVPRFCPMTSSSGSSSSSSSSSITMGDISLCPHFRSMMQQQTNTAVDPSPKIDKAKAA